MRYVMVVFPLVPVTARKFFVPEKAMAVSTSLKTGTPRFFSSSMTRLERASPGLFTAKTQVNARLVWPPVSSVTARFRPRKSALTCLSGLLSLKITLKPFAARRFEQETPDFPAPMTSASLFLNFSGLNIDIREYGTQNSIFCLLCSVVTEFLTTKAPAASALRPLSRNALSLLIRLCLSSQNGGGWAPSGRGVFSRGV